VGETLGESYDEQLAPAKLGLPDPIARVSFVLTQFLAKAIADPVWARLLAARSTQTSTELARGIRTNLKTDLTEAKA
jgi:hypothetical protein